MQFNWTNAVHCLTLTVGSGISVEEKHWQRRERERNTEIWRFNFPSIQPWHRTERDDRINTDGSLSPQRWLWLSSCEQCKQSNISVLSALSMKRENSKQGWIILRLCVHCIVYYSHCESQMIVVLWKICRNMNENETGENKSAKESDKYIGEIHYAEKLIPFSNG